MGVEAVLTGMVAQRGDSLVVQAELVRISDGAQIWGEHYNRRPADIFVVQEEVARNIVEASRLKLTGAEQQQLSKRYTENTEAYRLYLQGRYHKVTDGFGKRIEYYQQAIEKDPRYALAYSGLADTYAMLGGILPPREAMPKAKAYAVKALELDETLAEAHTSLGIIRIFYDWDFLGAERELKRAVELNPNYPDAHHYYSHYLQAVGRFDESVLGIKRAQELDPLSLFVNAELGWAFYLARQYDQTIAAGRKTLEMDPNFSHAHVILGQAYVQKGMYSEAIAELDKARALSGGEPDSAVVAELGYAYAASGQRGAAQRMLQELKERATREYIDPYLIASIYLGLGEKDEALHWLEKAYEDRSAWMVWLRVDPRLDSLRADPRFTNLLRRVGLAQ